jgi:hypothetical protein
MEHDFRDEHLPAVVRPPPRKVVAPVRVVPASKRRARRRGGAQQMTVTVVPTGAVPPAPGLCVFTASKAVQLWTTTLNPAPVSVVAAVWAG